jgi:hypothetical protein
MLVDRWRGKKAGEDESGPGMLYASGLIAGGALAGLLLAAAAGITSGHDPVTGKDMALADRIAVAKDWFHGMLSSSDGLSMLIFLALCFTLGFVGLRKNNSSNPGRTIP